MSAGPKRTVRPFTPQATWNAFADRWEEFIETDLDFYRTELHGPALVRLAGNVRGLRVLDLGCGQGYFSREMARRGALVSGVDLAPRMIAFAREHERLEPLGIDYQVGDAAGADRLWQKRRFDLVTACMSLDDMPRPRAVLCTASRALRPAGRFVFSVSHPSTDTIVREWIGSRGGARSGLMIDRYFDEGKKTVDWNMKRIRSPWKTPGYHWTIESWSRFIKKAGFIIDRLVEPRPSEGLVRQNRAFQPARRVPIFLLFDLRKA